MADKMRKEIDIVNLAYVQRTLDFLTMLMLKKDKKASVVDQAHLDER